MTAASYLLYLALLLALCMMAMLGFFYFPYAGGGAWAITSSAFLIAALALAYLLQQHRVLSERLKETSNKRENEHHEQQMLRSMAAEATQKLEAVRHERIEGDVVQQRKILESLQNMMAYCKQLMLEATKDAPAHVREEVARTIQKATAKMALSSLPSPEHTPAMSEEDILMTTIRELHPSLKEKDMQLCVQIFVGLTTQEIAERQGVTVKAIEKRRGQLRDHLQLSPKMQISDYLKGLVKP